jgi:hypothetical protein
MALTSQSYFITANRFLEGLVLTTGSMVPEEDSPAPLLGVDKDDKPMEMAEPEGIAGK